MQRVTPEPKYKQPLIFTLVYVESEIEIADISGKNCETHKYNICTVY